MVEEVLEVVEGLAEVLAVNEWRFRVAKGSESMDVFL